MGGDHAPGEIVRGSVLALERDRHLSVLLVGDESTVRRSLEECGADDKRIEVRHAGQVIEMGEPPVTALRTKTDTSIQRCVEALRKREVAAVISAGDTGGAVAATSIFGRRLKGVKRHGIAIPVPTVSGRALLIDVGANVHCKPIHLLQYAIMASSYAQEVMGIENPKVALLSVGEEEGKGNDLVKKTRNLLSRAELNFVGNVEGQAIFSGVADVMVCDGFVGNVILKVAEGLAEAFLQRVLSGLDAAGDAVASPDEFLTGIKKTLDYSTTGGAPLLGVDGSVIICHGRSRANAIANAIQVATDITKHRVNDRIVENVKKVSMLRRVREFFSSEQA